MKLKWLFTYTVNTRGELISQTGKQPAENSYGKLLWKDEMIDVNVSHYARYEIYTVGTGDGFVVSYFTRE